MSPHAALNLKRFGFFVLCGLTLTSFAPVFTLLMSDTVASIMHCPLDEGSTHPCIIGGTDFGDALYTGAVLGWLMLVTWPGMLITIGIWLVLTIRFLMLHTVKKA